MPPPTHRYLLWLALLIVALALVAGLALFITPSSFVQMAERVPPPAPTLTPERTTAALDASVFSALVSYTDQGFEPAQLTIAKGDTIRFVNNSTRTMTLSLENASHPPAGGLPPGEYWEYTFTQSGDAVFTEKGSDTQGVMHVQ